MIAVFTLMAGMCILGISTCMAATANPRSLGGLSVASAEIIADQAADSFRGEGWSPNGFSKGQCTWWVDGRANEKGWRLNFSQNYGRNAYKWWDMVTNAGKNQVGSKGSIMVMDRWVGNDYGHVLYVEDMLTSGSKWKVSHANFGAGSICRYVEGVPIRLVTATKSGSSRVSLGGASTYPLRGFLYKR